MTFKQLPKFPISIFDCTVVASEKTFVLDIVQLLKKQLKIKELQKVEVLTVFPLPQEEKKAVTLRSYFGSDEETLSGEFIKNAEQRVMSVLDAGGFPLR